MMEEDRWPFWNPDEEYEEDPPPPRTINVQIQEVTSMPGKKKTAALTRRKRAGEKVSIVNRFYVASDKVTRFDDTWAKPTLEEAINHAKDMLARDSSRQEIYVAQIVRRVRRATVPVAVDVVE